MEGCYNARSSKAMRILLILLSGVASLAVQAGAKSEPCQIRNLQITILSSQMAGSQASVGEWGFAALGRP